MLLNPPQSFDVRVQWSPYIPHSPTPKQHAALWIEDRRELLFGGQAGGGKSDWLLMAALQYVNVPGYAALILRRSYPDLAQPGAIMSRAKEWLAATDAKWNANDKEFVFPSGARLVFGYLKRDDDVLQYQGSEYQFIGFDELTQFSEYQYGYMHSRLRKPVDMRVPLRMRAATNPGGPGHQWVRRYFIKEGPGEGRIYIPSALIDNPYLDKEEYERSLQHLDPYTRAQLMHGDWTARPPGHWAFDHEHLDAVMAYGRKLREHYEKGGLPFPVDGVIHGGADFGEFSHVVAGVPREMSGMWVPFEHVYEKGEPDREAIEFYEKYERFCHLSDADGNPRGGFGKVPLGRMRFDSSKPESMRLFSRGLKQAMDIPVEFPLVNGKSSPIPFNKYKRASILWMRGMASRCAWGEERGALGIDPRYCGILEEQLYGLKYKDEDSEDLVKMNDHGPDAVFSLLAPDAKNRRAWQPPKDKPAEVREKAEREYQDKVSNLAPG